MKTNNPYDGVDAIRKIVPVMDAEQEERNYLEQVEYKTALFDHRIHIQQLRQCVSELQAHARSVDRVLKYIIGGSLFFAAVLGLIAWMSR